MIHPFHISIGPVGKFCTSECWWWCVNFSRTLFIWRKWNLELNAQRCLIIRRIIYTARTMYNCLCYSYISVENSSLRHLIIHSGFSNSTSNNLQFGWTTKLFNTQWNLCFRKIEHRLTFNQFDPELKVYG